MPFDYAPQVDFIKKMDALLIDNLYMDIGNHILSEGLKWKGAWPEDKTPSGLAKGILKKCLRSELELDFGAIDITEATFKNKSDEFWEGPGMEILDVIMKALGGAGAAQLVGEKTKPTPAMQSGMVPTAADIQLIAQSPEFERFRLILNGADSTTERFEAIRRILDADTDAAKLLKKCAMFTKELTDVTVKESDSSRVLVTNSFRAYDTLRGEILCPALNNLLSGSEIQLNDITTSDIVANVMGFVTATPATFHKSMDKAISLMLRCQTAELGLQSSQDLMESMEAVACVLAFTLGDLVGPDLCQRGIALRQTASIMRKWSAQDPEFVCWNQPGFYENSKACAYSLVTEIFYPILTAWLDKVWRYIYRQGSRPTTLVQLTLYDQLRSSSEDFSQMATFVKKMVSTKGLPASQQGGGKKPRPTCSHCGKKGHVETDCRSKHPELQAAFLAGNGGGGGGNGGRGGGKGGRGGGRRAKRGGGGGGRGPHPNSHNTQNDWAAQQYALSMYQPQMQQGFAGSPAQPGSPMSWQFPQQFAGFGLNSPPGQGKGKGESRACYNCGIVGHIGRDCPAKGKGAGGGAGAAAQQQGANAQQQMFVPPGVGYGDGSWGTPDNKRQKQG
jgi:hypothetical protein